MRRTIQIEFNELSPVLLDELIDAGELPNFGRLRDSSEVYVTDASDELTLEPWVQWPTLHTGICDRDHGIRHLGESARVSGCGIAREMANAGFKVGIFGSMNLDYGPLNGFVVPDPWNLGAAPHPGDLRAFTDFVVSAVQENSTAKLDKSSFVPFLRYLTTHGLTFGTAMSAARQLFQERRDGGLKWRRSINLDEISYDVFRNLVQRHDVAYATFFSNSTAHFQHYYWRNFRPECFEVPPPADDHISLTEAMLTGYRNHDRLLGRVLSDFADDRIILVTALSQEPWDTTKCTYRPLNVEALLTAMGVDLAETTVEPVMAEEFLLSFANKSTEQDALAQLSSCKIDEDPLFSVQETEPLRFKIGCVVNDWVVNDLIVGLPDGKKVPFRDLFVRIHGLRSGRHHPDGCFWVQSAKPRRMQDKIPITAVAPTILRMFEIDAPGYMKEPAVTLAETSHS